MMAFLGWLAGGLHVLGVIGVGNRRRGAFWLCIVGSMAWIVQASLTANPGLAASNAVFVALNLRAWALWGREQR